jgi:branched-subunit amino acid transport protein AzlD
MDHKIIYSVVIILLMALLTYGARLFPYLLFGRGRKVSPFVTYLGDVLPPAVMILLIVYCLRNLKLTVYPFGIPEFVAIGLAALLYKITKNNLIAMVTGTVVYMVLVQVVFG